MNIRLKTLNVFFIIFTFSVATIRASANELPKDMPIPGGVKILDISKYCLQGNARAYFQDNQILITQHSNKCFAVIGLPLELSAGKQEITIYNAKNRITTAFYVSKSSYPIETINSNLNKATKQVHNLPYPNKKLLSIWTTNHPTALIFKKPLNGKIIGAFGLERIYLNSKRPLHNGIDIAAPFNTAIHLPLSGTVLLTGKFNLLGNTIVINHGRGFMTLYAHLNKILVNPGQKLFEGQIIATSGKGYVVGSDHLHFSVIINTAFVNPELFIN